MTNAKALFTLSEYLERYQINLDHSKKHKLARTVAQAYKDMYQEELANAYRPNGLSNRAKQLLAIDLLNQVNREAL